MSHMKLRIATLLANNVKPAQVARAVNCSEQYISELCSNDEQFIAALQELKAQSIEQEVVIDQQYDTLEQTTLTKMNELVATADMRELGIALKLVNDRSLRVGRGGQAGVGGGNGANTIPVALPVYMAQSIQIQTNERNEIVEVQGKSMISLSPAQLTKQLKVRGRTDGGVEGVTDVAAVEHLEHVQGIEVREGGTAREAITARIAEIAKVGLRESSGPMLRVPVTA